MAADESERAGGGNAGLAVFSGASREGGAYNPSMPAIALPKLAQTIAEEVATLPEEKQFSVMDYVMFMKQRVEENGDAAWERIFKDEKKMDRFAAWAEKALKEEPVEELDFSKL